MKTHVLMIAVLGCAMVLCGTAGADAIPFSYSGPGVSVGCAPSFVRLEKNCRVRR
jgi:hypothetical protein